MLKEGGNESLKKLELEYLVVQHLRKRGWYAWREAHGMDITAARAGCPTLFVKCKLGGFGLDKYQEWRQALDGIYLVASHDITRESKIGWIFINKETRILKRKE